MSLEIKQVHALCPYCGHKKVLYAEVGPFLTICNPSEGGCDKMYVVTDIHIRAIVRTAKIGKPVSEIDCSAVARVM